MSLACGILVGGLSRRMGRPKALIPVYDTTLIERTASIARSVISDIVLLGRPSFELPGRLSSLVAIDDDPAGCGPIGGLAGFFKARPESDCLLIACDMPGLDVRLLRKLIAAVDEEVEAVVPGESSNGGAIHPCCALYRSSAASAVFDAIAGGRYSMHELLDRIRVRWLPLAGSEVAWVENVNTPADLERHCVTTNGESMTRLTGTEQRETSLYRPPGATR